MTHAGLERVTGEAALVTVVSGRLGYVALGEGSWALAAAAVGLILYGVYFVLLVRGKAL